MSPPSTPPPQGSGSAARPQSLPPPRSAIPDDPARHSRCRAGHLERNQPPGSWPPVHNFHVNPPPPQRHSGGGRNLTAWPARATTHVNNAANEPPAFDTLLAPPVIPTQARNLKPKPTDRAGSARQPQPTTGPFVRDYALFVGVGYNSWQRSIAPTWWTGDDRCLFRTFQLAGPLATAPLSAACSESYITY